MVLENKKIVVVGLGRSGAATARFLTRRGAGVTVTDRALPGTLQDAVKSLDGLGVRWCLGRHAAEDFEAADMVVLSPGVPHTLPVLDTARNRGVPVIGEMELAARFITEPIVAVTGTNGKTTTTELTAKMLECSGKRVFMGGNIGTPLVAYADNENHQVDVVVIEVSSFQLDTSVTFRPDTAVLLNITDDHLDRYPDFDAYAESKWRIFANQQPADTAILNGMDATVVGLMDKCPLLAQRQIFSDRHMLNGAQIEADRITMVHHRRVTGAFSLKQSGLIGPHNRENTAAACLAARAAGATDTGIQEAIDAFVGLPHRLETVGWVGGVRFVNDSKATNVDALKRALACFDRPVVLIMGGQNKRGDFTQLRPYVQRRVKTIVAMGEARREIEDALAGTPQRGLLGAASLEEAVDKAVAAAANGDTVLLSPACASFDMFDSYAHRGSQFKEIVRGLL